MFELTMVFLGVFFAEFGDKTMMVTIRFGSKEKDPYRLIWGLVPACVFVPLIGIGFGLSLQGGIQWILDRYPYVPGLTAPICINLISAIIMYFIAWKSLQELAEGDEEKEEGRIVRLVRWLCGGRSFASILIYAATFAVAESFDRTQIVTIGATVQGSSWIPNWLGSALGLYAANHVALFLLEKYKEHFSQELLIYMAAVIFLVCGTAMTLSTFKVDQSLLWAMLLAIVGLQVPMYEQVARWFGFMPVKQPS